MKKLLSLSLLAFLISAQSYAAGEEEYQAACTLKNTTRSITYEVIDLLHKAAQLGHIDALEELKYRADNMNSVQGLRVVWGGDEVSNIKIRAIFAQYVDIDESAAEEYYRSACVIKDTIRPLPYEFFNLLHEAAQLDHSRALQELKYLAKCMNSGMDLINVWRDDVEFNKKIRTILEKYIG